MIWYYPNPVLKRYIEYAFIFDLKHFDVVVINNIFFLISSYTKIVKLKDFVRKIKNRKLFLVLCNFHFLYFFLNLFTLEFHLSIAAWI